MSDAKPKRDLLKVLISYSRQDLSRVDCLKRLCKTAMPLPIFAANLCR